ncbi:formyltransferase family protein, partial [Traorella massiliensis]|uniref:formyltransferase family protein n=1 Tax=Traorella massiliensis TaxID=1903263 RepID=UPI00248EC718
MKSIAVFASGTGTNFEAIQKAIEDHQLEASIECVVSDHRDAKVVEKARQKNIE